jgi:hypothetical protein
MLPGRVLLLVACALLISACQASQPVDPGPLTSPQTPAIPTPVITPAVPVDTTTPETVLVTTTPEGAVTPIPEQAFSEWELVQQTLTSYRNRLDRSSDGYNGLTLALQEADANETWCGGVAAAVGDFAYVNDADAVRILSELMASQGCP